MWRLNFAKFVFGWGSSTPVAAVGSSQGHMCDTRSQEAPLATDPAEDRVQAMCDDALCIC